MHKTPTALSTRSGFPSNTRDRSKTGPKALRFYEDEAAMRERNATAAEWFGKRQA
jgi:hypothetical protein